MIPENRDKSSHSQKIESKNDKIDSAAANLRFVLMRSFVCVIVSLVTAHPLGLKNWDFMS